MGSFASRWFQYSDLRSHGLWGIEAWVALPSPGDTGTQTPCALGALSTLMGSAKRGESFCQQLHERQMRGGE